MAADPAFKGRARRWYLLPVILGLCLMAFAILLVVWDWLIRVLVAIPFFLAGLALLSFGFDLWRGIPDWRGKAESIKYRVWPDEKE